MLLCGGDRCFPYFRDTMTTPKSVHSTSWLGQWMVSCISGLLFKKLFIFGCVGSSLRCGVFSSCGKQRLLIVVASLLWSTVSGTQASAVAAQVGSVAVAPGLSGAGSVAVAQGLSCSPARGIFLDQGSNPCLLHWQVDFSTLSHLGSSSDLLFDMC